MTCNNTKNNECNSTATTPVLSPGSPLHDDDTLLFITQFFHTSKNSFEHDEQQKCNTTAKEYQRALTVYGTHISQLKRENKIIENTKASLVHDLIALGRDPNPNCNTRQTSYRQRFKELAQTQVQLQSKNEKAMLRVTAVQSQSDHWQEKTSEQQKTLAQVEKKYKHRKAKHNSLNDEWTRNRQKWSKLHHRQKSSIKRLSSKLKHNRDKVFKKQRQLSELRHQKRNRAVALEITRHKNQKMQAKIKKLTQLIATKNKEYLESKNDLSAGIKKEQESHLKMRLVLTDTVKKVKQNVQLIQQNTSEKKKLIAELQTKTELYVQHILRTGLAKKSQFLIDYQSQSLVIETRES